MAAARLAVLCDLSGTLHIEDKALDGAIAALRRLRQHAEVLYVTNTTKESRQSLWERVSLRFDEIRWRGEVLNLGAASAIWWRKRRFSRL